MYELPPSTVSCCAGRSLFIILCVLFGCVYQVFQTDDAEAKISSLVPEGNLILGLTYRLRNEFMNPSPRMNSALCKA